MSSAPSRQLTRCAARFSAMGTVPRLRIMRLLLSAHPRGMVVGDLQRELAIPASTLSFHLEKLRKEGLVSVRREQRFLWYAADAGALSELLGFLYAECCSRSNVVPAESLVRGKRGAMAGSKPARPNKEMR